MKLILTIICWLLTTAAFADSQLVIDTEPKDAEVFVDGTSKGKTPLSVLVAAGKHTVEIRKQGMQSVSRTVNMGDGVTQALDKIQLQAEPLPDLSKILNPVKDAFETQEQFAARVQKDLAEFNRHVQAGDVNYRVAWLTLNKDAYRIETGYFSGAVNWDEPIRDWGAKSGIQQIALTIPQKQVKEFWATGEAVNKEVHRFPLFISLKQQAGRMELERVFVRGLGQEWLAKTEQISNFRDCAECPEMVSIPSLGFSIGKYEVTQGQWKAMMGNNPSNFTACGDDCPVEQVSWNDVQAFIVKLNQRTGKQYRLPSEKEWETACRAGGQHEYCGSDTVDDVGWYDKNSGQSTHPVGKKKPNAFGLYDMSGNVYEWVQDCYEGDCTRHVLRGGSWYFGAIYLRSVQGYKYASDFRNSLGFRFALGQTAL